MRKFLFVLPLFLLLLSCGGKKTATNAPASRLDEPDRVLFERAMHDLDKNKFTVARLTLQTLINTYPDSEFLPQAKYALAESFYRESSNSSLNQAEAEFKDYITFFPTSDLAPDAQLKIALTHVRRMEKPDRDRTQATLAEAELKSMIESYPDSRLLDEAKDKLRGVQEVLAEGVERIASFYYLKRAYPAAIARYKEIMTKYPDYSQMPDTLYYLAESLRHSNNEPEAGIYYARIVTDHPLSERVDEAKHRLTAMNMPIPEANPVALARAQAAPKDDRSMLGKVVGLVKHRSPVSTDTAAASSAAEEEQDTAPTPVRGGTSGSGGTTRGTDNTGSDFSIDSKVVQPGASKPPAKKLR
ncbi:MAG TPA: outer membrane protein assembly factor BamD [Terriglobia bacterium]|nr:outer membrane protein assembly factor BamD [Terriglobia bacterium]